MIRTNVHKILNHGLLILVISLLGGCSRTDELQGAKKELVDLPAFFQEEINRLSTSGFALEKTVALNGAEEHARIPADSVVWAKELQEFLTSDINKPAIVEKYRKFDSTDTKGNTYVSFVTANPKLKIAKVLLQFVAEDTIPAAVHITTQTANFLVRSRSKLHYNRTSGFAIEGWQDVLLMDESTYHVLGTFNRDERFTP